MTEQEPDPISTPPESHPEAVPMRSLYARIDQLLPHRKDLPDQLRGIASELPHSSTRRTLYALAHALDNNASAAELVTKFPYHCWLLTLRSASATTEALTAILEQSAFEQKLRKKRIRSVSYPAILLPVATLILLAACALLVPPFDEMYQDFGLRLPGMTLLLIRFSRTLSAHPIIVVSLIAALIALFVAALWYWIGVRPRINPSRSGSTGMRQSLSKSAIQLAELCDDGLSLNHALRITAESDPSRTMRGLLAELSMSVANPASEIDKTRAAMFFPPNFLFALQPGGAGKQPNTPMLRELSANYRELSLGHREWSSFIFGQLVIIGVGIMIGFMVLTLYMPLVSLISGLS